MTGFDGYWEEVTVTDCHGRQLHFFKEDDLMLAQNEI